VEPWSFCDDSSEDFEEDYESRSSLWGDADTYLDAFSDYVSTEHLGDDFCLVYSFTGHSFDEILGMAYVALPAPRSMSTGIHILQIYTIS